jgi:hypothetical protein
VKIHECVETEGVVVKTIGELEHGAGGLERHGEARPEAFRPGEAEADHCFEPCIVRRLPEGFLKNRNGEVVVLELGEEQERLGTHRPARGLGEQLVRNRAGTRPLAGRKMRPRGSECPPLALVPHFGGGESERLLGEFCRNGGCTAIGRELGGVLERAGDVGVGRVHRERAMTCTDDWVVCDRRQACMNRDPLFLKVVVDAGREQRMRETNRGVLAFDYMRRKRRLMSVSASTPARSRSLLDGVPTAAASASASRVGRGKTASPRAYNLVERLRNRQRLQRIDLVRKRAGDLQREKRVSTRALVDPEERLSGERPAQPVVQEPVQRAGAERSDDETPRFQARSSSEGFHAVVEPPRQQEPQIVARESTQRERQCRGRRRIEPLHVVDCNEHTAVAASECSASRTATASARESRRSSDSCSRSNATSSACRLGGGSTGSISSRMPSRRSPNPT